ncbi:MAG: hypothetical protein LBS55_01235 [Prevotellaceae bacterium]|jgi:hypothetical protein|nr:hypothetical protein [Prevotellaceae bacterium]
MKYQLFLLFLLCTFVVPGQQVSENKKEYNRIIRKMEQRIDKNYYTDSVAPVKHYEYTFNDTAMQLLRAVYVEYFPLPVWAWDSKYYTQRFRFDNRVFPIRVLGYVLNAKLYEAHDSLKVGFMVPYNAFASANFSALKLNYFSTSLLDAITNNHERREAVEERRNKDMRQLDASMSFTMKGTPVFADSSHKVECYEVGDTLYQGIPCYRLRHRVYDDGVFIYGNRERAALEQNLQSGAFFSRDLHTGAVVASPQSTVDGFKRRVEYWANGAYRTESIHIIAKKDYALLDVVYRRRQSNYAGRWEDVCYSAERFERGNDGKYHQAFYKEIVRNYKGGLHNDENIITCVVRVPFDTALSISAARPLQRINGLSYKDFCEILSAPDEEMLEEWIKIGESW